MVHSAYWYHSTDTSLYLFQSQKTSIQMWVQIYNKMHKDQGMLVQTMPCSWWDPQSGADGVDRRNAGYSLQNEKNNKIGIMLVDKNWTLNTFHFHLTYRVSTMSRPVRCVTMKYIWNIWNLLISHMWCDLGKSVGTRTCDIFSFLFNWSAHLERYLLLKTPPE